MPDSHGELHELLGLWHGQRRSIRKSRQHLLGEAEGLLCELPLALREQLPDIQAVRPRLAVMASRNRRRRYSAATMLRLGLLDGYQAQITKLDREDQQVVAQLAELVAATGSTLAQLCGLSTMLVSELLDEVGDPRRFTEGGFARFSGSAPLQASTAEGPGEPVRHRYNPGGNRRVNRVLHLMAITQLRCEPRAQALYAKARADGHTKKEARRNLNFVRRPSVGQLLLGELDSPDRWNRGECIRPEEQRSVWDELALVLAGEGRSTAVAAAGPVRLLATS